MNNKHSLANYIKYINQRLRLLSLIGRGCSNENKYYHELLSRIRSWGTSHIICYRHLTGEIRTRDVIKLFGMPERTVARKLQEQRAKLCKEIQKWEEELKVTYPFEPVDLSEE